MLKQALSLSRSRRPTETYAYADTALWFVKLRLQEECPWKPAPAACGPIMSSINNRSCHPCWTSLTQHSLSAKSTLLTPFACYRSPHPSLRPSSCPPSTLPVPLFTPHRDPRRQHLPAEPQPDMTQLTKSAEAKHFSRILPGTCTYSMRISHALGRLHTVSQALVPSYQPVTPDSSPPAVIALYLGPAALGTD